MAIKDFPKKFDVFSSKLSIFRLIKNCQMLSLLLVDTNVAVAYKVSRFFALLTPIPRLTNSAKPCFKPLLFGVVKPPTNRHSLNFRLG